MSEKEIQKDLRDICNKNDKKEATRLIEEKYSGCSVDMLYRYSEDRLDKMVMGSFLWENFCISF